MVQSIPTKQGEESSGNPNMNDLYTLCDYVSIIPYLYLKWQANNKSKMSWKLKSLGALEWPSTGLTCYHLHDPPFMAWDMAINPCWLHSPNAWDGAHPKIGPKIGSFWPPPTDSSGPRYSTTTSMHRLEADPQPAKSALQRSSSRAMVGT